MSELIRNKLDFTTGTIIPLLKKFKFCLDNEKLLQSQMEIILINNGIEFSREHKLDKHNIPDFFIGGLTIEIKIKGTAKNIYKQCLRYCEFEDVKEIILITNRSMGFPKELNGKPCYIINLGKAWL